MDVSIVTYAELSAYLGNPSDDQALLTALIARVSTAVETLTRRWFLTRETTEYHTADSGDEYLFLKRFPVVEGRVTVIDTEDDDTEITDFVLDPDDGSLYLSGGWGSGVRRYQVTYTAGYAEGVAGLPADIKQAVMEIVNHKYEHPDPAVTAEKIGDYSYSLGDGGTGLGDIPGSTRDILARYTVPVL